MASTWLSAAHSSGVAAMLGPGDSEPPAGGDPLPLSDEPDADPVPPDGGGAAPAGEDGDVAVPPPPPPAAVVAPGKPPPAGAGEPAPTGGDPGAKADPGSLEEAGAPGSIGAPPAAAAAGAPMSATTVVDVDAPERRPSAASPRVSPLHPARTTPATTMAASRRLPTDLVTRTP